MTQSRLLPTVLLAASSWLLISLFGSQQSLGTSPSKIEGFFGLPVSHSEVEDLLPGGHFAGRIFSPGPNRHARLQG